MAAINRITPIDESEVAVNESAGSERSEPTRAVRRHLPDERRALTHHFSIAGQEGYLTVGVYEDGLPGEIFITMAKQGSTISGLMDAFATVVSLALQHGVPLRVLCDKLSHMRFEPSGWSGNPKIGYAKSLMDYIARWLELRFLNGGQGELLKALPMSIQPARDAKGTDPIGALGQTHRDGRCARLQHLRFADGTERNVLPLHDVRGYKRVFVARSPQPMTYNVGGPIR